MNKGVLPVSSEKNQKTLRESDPIKKEENKTNSLSKHSSFLKVNKGIYTFHSETLNNA